jgi:hypothetical protein
MALMNIIFDALNAQLDAGDRRMDQAGVPKIVRERCPNPRCINGHVEVTHVSSWQVSVQRCTTCAGKGYVRRET